MANQLWAEVCNQNGIWLCYFMWIMRSAVMQLLFANLSSFLVICVVFSTEMHTHTARIWPSEQHIEHQIEQLNCCCLRWPNMNSNETNHYITAYLLFLIRFHILAIIHVPCVCVCVCRAGRHFPTHERMQTSKRKRDRVNQWFRAYHHWLLLLLLRAVVIVIVLHWQNCATCTMCHSVPRKPFTVSKH